MAGSRWRCLRPGGFYRPRPSHRHLARPSAGRCVGIAVQRAAFGVWPVRLGRGELYPPIAIPDVGTTYTFTGTGSVTPLGSDTLTGSLTTPGFILNGLEKGSLTLTNSKGTVTISLSGPAVSPIAAATPTFKLTYAITGGTGAYKNLRGIGTATLALHPTLPPPPLVFGVTQVGQFTLALKAGTVPLA